MSIANIATDSGGFLVAFTGVLLTLSGLLSLALSRQVKHLRERDEHREATLLSLQANVQLRAGAPDNSSERQLLLERQLDQLRSRQDQLEMSSPESQTYERAITRIQNGAGIEQIIADFGLSRGEAELIHSVHQNKGG